MRSIFVCLILFSSLFARAQGALDSLQKAGLISNAEKTHALRQSQKKLRFDDASLNVLQKVKMYSTPGTYTGFNFMPADIEIPASKKAQTIAALTAFADKLLQAKLISAKTHEELTKKITPLELKWEYELVAYAALATNREYYFQPGFFNRFADSLFFKDIISKNDYETILAKSASGEIRNRIDYLKYLKNAVIINLKEQRSDTAQFLEKIYRKTASAFPTLPFDKFSYKVELDSAWSNDTIKIYNAVVTIEKNGQVFRHKSYYDPRALDIDEQEYYEIFNKMLADRQSPYRLHRFEIDQHSFGIIALTKTQWENLVWWYDDMQESYIVLSYEKFVNKLTQANIQSAINTYDSLGLFTHLTKKEKDSCIRELSTKTMVYYSDLLSGFKNLVFEIDLEYGIENGQYKKLTKHLASISKGHFNPTNIIDEYNFDRNRKFWYGFTLNGKKYLTKLEQTDDWLDPLFYDLIDQAVKEQDAGGAFYYLYPNDGMRIIYLTHAQYAALTQLQLIELRDADAE
jgi:hypothetical protein